MESRMRSSRGSFHPIRKERRTWMNADGQGRFRHAAFVFTSVALCSLVLLTTQGCGSGPAYVPVSGTVRLNGEPYKDAIVTFQPMATATNSNPGRGSSAYTDNGGRFVLLTFEGGEGAVPGKHRIRIATKGADIAIEPEKGTSDNATPVRKQKTDPIPRAWNIESDKEFEVPKNGTDKADFDIKTK